MAKKPAGLYLGVVLLIVGVYLFLISLTEDVFPLFGQLDSLTRGETWIVVLFFIGASLICVGAVIIALKRRGSSTSSTQPISKG